MTDLIRSTAKYALPACLSLLLVAVGSADAKRIPRGGLTQLSGNGCSVDAPAPKGCTNVHGVRAPQMVTISPDGRNLYAPGNQSGSVAVFSRNASNGTVTQLATPAGCISTQSSPFCVPGRATTLSFDAIISPDGRNVYVSAAFPRQIAVFTRDPATGALTQPLGAAGCVQGPNGTQVEPVTQTGCTPVKYLPGPRGLAISPDGGFLYAATLSGDAVVTLKRDPVTGTLSDLPQNCIATKKRKGCARATNLDGATDIELSGDGRFAYVASYTGSSVSVLSRNANTGKLSQVPGGGGCVSSSGTGGCSAARGLAGAYHVALTRDGSNVYAAARRGRAIVTLSRNAANGAIAQPAGDNGCVSGGVLSGCKLARGLNGTRGVAVSPDGHSVYGGSFTDSAVTAFARNSAGGLKQIRGRAGCLSARKLKDCGRARAVSGAWGVAVSSDGRFVYSGSGHGPPGGIGVFARKR